MGKYLDLAREIKKNALEHGGDDNTYRKLSFWNYIQESEKETGVSGDLKKKRYHSDYNTVKIGLSI